MDEQGFNQYQPSMEEEERKPPVCPLCGMMISTPDGMCPRCGIKMRTHFPGAAILFGVAGALLGIIIAPTLERGALVTLCFGGFGLGFDLIGYFTYTRNRMRRVFRRVVCAAPYGALAGGLCGGYMAPELMAALKWEVENVYYSFGLAGAFMSALFMLVMSVSTDE